MTQHRYGWKKDVRGDKRDFKFKALMAPAPVLPLRVDLRPGCSPVEDQGNLGSCTANAWAGAIEFLEKKDGVAFWDASRLYIYYFERLIEGTVNEDSGAFIRDGAKALAKYGVCTESEWPYIISKFRKSPCTKQQAAGQKRKITAYYSVESLTEIKTALAVGYPVVFGFSVYESFESNAVTQTGIVPMPESDEQILGGHAVLAVGYDDKRRWVICRNSWGPDWGASGYFFLPYEFISDPSKADEFWVLEKGTLMMDLRK